MTTARHATLRQLTDRLANNLFHLPGTTSQRRAASEAALSSLDEDPGLTVEVVVTGHYRAYVSEDRASGQA